MSHATSEALHARVRRFITGGEREPFETLALDIASYQAENVAPVSQLWRGLGLAGVTSVQDIPALPSEVFRLRRVAAHPPEQDKRCFQTSGTTAAARGKHPMRTIATYALGAVCWGRELLFPDHASMPMVVLACDESTAPSSSLTFMLARFAEELGGDVSWHFDGDRVDIDAVIARARRLTQPTLIAGTSFAFVHLLDALADTRLPLAPGSRVMQTGGFKGRSRVVAADELRAALATCFDVPSQDVVGEYGMTELSSQLYERGDRYHPPPWLRVSAVDPETLAPVQGEGLARFVDLANVDSAVAVQTADRITCHDDGSISLHGRMPGATPRGCSLALEHLIEAS